MKRISLFLISLVLLSPMGVAQQEGFSFEVTPNQGLLYQGDLALDQALYFVSSVHTPTQANVGLNIAKERLREAEIMEEKNRTQLAEKARERARKRQREVERIRNRYSQRERVPDWVNNVSRRIENIRRKQPSGVGR